MLEGSETGSVAGLSAKQIASRDLSRGLRQALFTARMKPSKAEAEATREHQLLRADEAVTVLGTNLRPGERLLRNLSSDTIDPF